MEQTLPAAIVTVGDKIGRYNVLGKLATGGMAEVFLARQDGPMGFTKHVVVKRILPQYATDDEFLHMFLNEARLAAMINHPNVVSIYELGEDAPTHSLFMAMEYIDGRNLKDLLKRAVAKGSQLPIRMCARLVADACAGLDFAHDLKDPDGRMLNLVHRDISADNILVSYSGQVKVVDFGIAKAALTENRTKTGQVKGKFGYMSPEMLLGQPIDRRTDVWALGIVLYWLLAGRRPFRGDNEGQIVNQVVNGALPAMERTGAPIPKELEAIVEKALQKDPDRRYLSAGQLRTDLDLWLARSGDPVTTSSVAEVMEKLFPAAKDDKRVAMARLVRGERRPSSDWEHSSLLQRSISDSDRLVPNAGTPTPSGNSGSGSSSQAVSQVLAPPTSPARPRRWLAAGVLGGALVAFGGFYLVSLGLRSHPPAVDPAPEPTPGPPPLAALPQGAADQPAPAAPKPEPAPAPIPAAPTPSPLAKREAQGKGPHAKKGAHSFSARSEPREPAPPLVIAPPPPVSAPAEEKPAVAGPPGKLAVDVRPWATVFVDGARVGMTPIDPLSLPAGRHKVELVNDEIGAHEVLNVTIKSDELYNLRKKLGTGQNQ